MGSDKWLVSCFGKRETLTRVYNQIILSSAVGSVGCAVGSVVLFGFLEAKIHSDL